MSKKHTLFITGIDTDAGKTVAAAIAVKALKSDYWKPIQSGDLEFSDTHKVMKYTHDDSLVFHPEAYRLTQPMSPHASAALDGITIDLKKIQVPETENHLVIEGAGGLMVPLNDRDYVADLIQPEYKVILVTKHYLGSINHTLISYNYLKNKGIKNIAIWINGPEHTTTEQAFKAHTNAYFLERIDHLDALSPENIAQQASKISESLSAFLEME